MDAEEKTKAFANASALPVDMGDLHKVSCLVAEADVVIRCGRQDACSLHALNTGDLAFQFATCASTSVSCEPLYQAPQAPNHDLLHSTRHESLACCVRDILANGLIGRSERLQVRFLLMFCS